MTNLLNDVKQVKEVKYSDEAQKLINDGWNLIGVFQRSAIFPDGVEASFVYVLTKNE